MPDDHVAPIPEETIEEAEHRPGDHHHDGPSFRGSLAPHLRDAHGLDAPDSMSDATLEGLHDRVHHERHASEH